MNKSWYLGLFSDGDVVLLLLIIVLVSSPVCHFVGFVSPLPVKLPKKIQISVVKIVVGFCSVRLSKVNKLLDLQCSESDVLS